MTSKSMAFTTFGLVKGLENVLKSAKVIVDIGGGQGALASQILLAHPHLTATILDLVCYRLSYESLLIFISQR